jgi:hypothetical protein
MRYYEITNEDIGRRGFLRGLGAAAGLGTLGLQAYKQNTRQDAPPPSTSAQNASDKVATQPSNANAPTVASQPQKVIPKYQPGSVKSPEFAKKLRHIGALLGVNPDDLLKVMYFETKGTLDPSIQNSIGATGLIQFMPDTAKGLGTTVDNLKKMSASDQLHYVYEYYKKIVKPGMTAADIYLATLLPVSLKMKPSTIVAKKNDHGRIKRNSSITKHKMYTKNPVFDPQKKNYYTVADIRSVINGRSAPTLDSLSNT